ncbi:hypothetical protein M438DRAFT_345293 [Aureobasidium pullulans EXF-150]|uniref:Uncharacterized protein n=1 Tax=Aureobasidium pullulans EXF-150 TaxID=1043002 RepID=A0A074YE81_AURPU|nr:uncharacterized protein M438DRAFT_345293 [Aureobasidium pullulans EXF-150]KEQ85111.1 hypothetical protein M438DRAFT_345293 [Aureobasidium pullulans EXF-150]
MCKKNSIIKRVEPWLHGTKKASQPPTQHRPLLPISKEDSNRHHTFQLRCKKVVVRRLLGASSLVQILRHSKRASGVMAAGAGSLVQGLGSSRADHRGGLPIALNNPFFLWKAMPVSSNINHQFKSLGEQVLPVILIVCFAAQVEMAAIYRSHSSCMLS